MGDALVTSCRGRIDTQLHMLEEANVTSRFSGLGHLVQNNDGGLICQIRCLSEAMGFARWCLWNSSGNLTAPSSPTTKLSGPRGCLQVFRWSNCQNAAGEHDL